MNTRTGAAAAAVSAGLVGLMLVTTGTAAYPSTPPRIMDRTSSSPLELVVPAQMTAPSYRNTLPVEELGIRVTAGSEPFELWSRRASYADQISTQWRRTAGTVDLPAGTLSDFGGLPAFLDVEVRDTAGHLLESKSTKVCLNGDTQRIRPEGAARSPYPWGCPRNAFTVGSVMGLQAGWATRVGGYRQPLRLKPGRYSVVASIAPTYRAMFEIADADAIGEMDLRVVRYQDLCCERATESLGSEKQTAGTLREEPNVDPSLGGQGAEPGDPQTMADGPVPNLKSLPAFGIRMAQDGRYLKFAATVWNAGESPLVVDGFRRDGEDVMDAYQYFFDADGNQVGFDLVGTMGWDERDSHRHWHFRDFARYRLVDADGGAVRRSKKEAFCLANTDAVDYTIPNANWKPDGTDLVTACGDHSSVAVREVLDVGSGDTYNQSRAGQSFDLNGIPNGVYYVAVEANPMRRLVESSTEDNVALRKIRVRGPEGARRVEVFPVGLIGAN